MIEERIEEMWARTSKFVEEGTLEEHLPEQLEFFSREILPPLAVRALFQGVGKLDEVAANTVLSEMGKACGGFALASLAASGLEIPTQDVDSFLAAHAKAESVASGGRSTVTRDGNTATIVITGGCVCPLVRTQQIEGTPNHCLCTVNHLRHLYQTGLGRPVEVELIETHLRGGNSCTIRMSW